MTKLDWVVLVIELDWVELVTILDWLELVTKLNLVSKYIRLIRVISKFEFGYKTKLDWLEL